MAKKNVAADPEAKRAALQLAAGGVGPAEASRRTGIPASTIRAWRTRAGHTDIPAGAAGEDWRAGREQTAESAAKAAREAIEQARRELRAGKPLRAQQAMVAAGIAVDKIAVIESQLAAHEVRRADIGEGQAQKLAAVIELALRAGGIPADPLRAAIRELLERAGRDEPLVVSPAIAQQAYTAVRGHFERIVREELAAERRALPAPGLPDLPTEGAGADVSDTEPALSRSGGQLETTGASYPTPESPEEIIDAEVVDDPPLAFDVEEVARRVSEQIAGEEEEADGWGGLYRGPRESFSIDDPGSSIVRGGPHGWGH